MSRKEKLKEKLLDGNQDQNWRLDELCTLLPHLEFTEREGKGRRDQGREVRGIGKAYQIWTRPITASLLPGAMRIKPMLPTSSNCPVVWLTAKHAPKQLRK